MDSDYKDLVRERILQRETLIRAAFTGEQKGSSLPWVKVTVRPVELKGQIHLQFSYFDEKKDITKNFTFLTRGDLYSNYLRNPQNMDISWETLWTLKVNNWFGATLNTLLLYDHDIDVPKVKEVVNGIPVPGTPGPGAQFKETLGIGLTFAL